MATVLTENVAGTAPFFSGETWPRTVSTVGCTDAIIGQHVNVNVNMAYYDTEELVAIFGLISGGKQYHLDEGGEAALTRVVEAEPRGRGFGNARFVRNVFEAGIGHHALRLADIEAPTDEQLTTLTEPDIRPV